MTAAQQPIGVFDSGVGGLSVLQALRAELPHERFVYLADSGNAPYGERGDAFVQARTHAITDYLLREHHIKALVVACNTATAAAIHEVRARHPQLPLVGVEPALKPAVAASRTGRIGVIGTRGTLTSAKFARLLATLDGQAQFVVQPCDGLAHAIERSTAQALPTAPDATETRALCARYTGLMGPFGIQNGQIDTLVLGCTHYVFVQDELRGLLGPEVRLIDTGEPVARQTRRLLQAASALAPETGPPTTAITLLTTGALAPLQNAATRWLQLPAQCCATIDLPVGPA
ncbi:glutamate racemase [Simplicispira lacusdiani]|uniref:glutamate racemase n=1 Tax=Simplicispira lacusdiani TaxID=2213010 RepID=UPI000E70DB7E|nr:glutamate racemase [Simplicispira lacusdiani]